MNCIKRKYKTEKEAELGLQYVKDVRKIHRREKHPIRYYYCDYCKNYHLTSQPANIEEAELIHVFKFQDFLEKQKIEEKRKELQEHEE